MKKISALILTFLFILFLVSCKPTVKVPPKEEVPGDKEDPKTEVISVKEVIEKEDLTYVEFEGIVIGYDLGMRHIVIEDLDGSATIQSFKNPGFMKVRVGDKVLVKGYRTFDRGVNRVAPNSIETVTKENQSSYNNPIVIQGNDIPTWTQENRLNPNILFKVYEFKNVLIKSATTGYTYIDDTYEETGGRGLKIGIKNDSSVYSADNFVVGERYNIKAVAYGISDDFYNESIEGTVIRLSVMHEDDITLITEGNDATIVVNGKQSFIANDENIKPDFKSYFQITDKVDGKITITDSMIEENVDVKTPGIYDVKVSYVNSEAYLTSHIIKIFVSVDGVDVDYALTASVNSDLHVKGVVQGFGQKSTGSKTAIIIENNKNGKAIEFWASESIGNFDSLNVGDEILVYAGKISPEKGLPRLRNVELIEVKSQNNSLYEAKEVTDLAEWGASLKDDTINAFGRITFEAMMVEVGSTYKYFVRNSSGKIVQVAIHSDSKVTYNWELGKTYRVTAVLLGLSDPFTALESKSIVARLGVMNNSDIELIEDENPVDPNENLTVTDALNTPVGTLVTFESVVLGFGYNANGYKTSLILSNPENGDSIELWLNKVTDFESLKVGDYIKVSGIRSEEKGYARLTGYQLIEVIDKVVNIPAAREISNLKDWSSEQVKNNSKIIGRYTFEGTVISVGGYVYFLKADETTGNILQVAVHQDQSFYKYNWVVGSTYQITGVLYGISDPLSALATKSITTRIGIMNESDITLLENVVEPEKNLTVTDAINADIDSIITIEGVVTGYGQNNNGEKTALILSNPENGDSIEIWRNQADANNRIVIDNLVEGDFILITGIKAIEKSYSRLKNPSNVTIIGKKNVPNAKDITNTKEWTENLVINQTDILGKYTFEAEVLETGNYVYFLKTSGTNILQFAVYQEQSLVKFNFEVGKKYKVTAVLFGISDKFESLSTKSIVTRLGIMNESDVILIDN